jgi:tetratricopeptide (TPR) repeat protein
MTEKEPCHGLHEILAPHQDRARRDTQRRQVRAVGLAGAARSQAYHRETRSSYHRRAAGHRSVLYLDKLKDTRHAEPLLDQAASDHRKLGRLFAKYGLTLMFHLPITEEFAAHVGPTLRGVLLAQTECFQLAGKWEQAYETLLHLRKLEPRDPVVLLSLIELVWQANGGNEETCRYIVGLAKSVANDSPVHSVLLLYKARALRGLGMNTAARDILTPALRRKKDREPEIMHALRYERALVYEALGQAQRARADYERLYAEDTVDTDIDLPF